MSAKHAKPTIRSARAERRIASSRLAAAFLLVVVLTLSAGALSAYKAEYVGAGTATIAGTGTWSVEGTVKTDVYQGQECAYALAVAVEDPDTAFGYEVKVATAADAAVQDVRFKLYRLNADGTLGAEVLRAAEGDPFADEGMRFPAGGGRSEHRYLLKFLPNESGALSFDASVNARQVD